MRTQVLAKKKAPRRALVELAPESWTGLILGG